MKNDHPLAASSSSTPPPPPLDGAASIDVARRPRGRPPGSKNKPKPAPPLVPDPTSLLLAPYVLEVPPRNDIVQSVSRFCRRNSLSLLLFSATGFVSNFTLRQPSPTPAPSTLTFHGRFELLSLSATFVGEGGPEFGDGVVVTVAGTRGQIVGGKVVGPLVADGTVVVVAASFNRPSFHRLGVDREQEGEEDMKGNDNAPPRGQGVVWAGRPQQPPQRQLTQDHF